MLLSTVGLYSVSCAAPQTIRLYPGKARNTDAIAHIQASRGAVIIAVDNHRFSNPIAQPLEVLPGFHRLQIGINNEVFVEGSHETTYEVKSDSKLVNFVADAGQSYAVIVKFITQRDGYHPYGGIFYDPGMEIADWEASIVDVNGAVNKKEESVE